MAAKKSRTNQRITRPKQLRTVAARPEDFADEDLSPAQQKELERCVEDLGDRTRYLLVSTLGPEFALYYSVSDDTYGWNDPTHATLFKRRNSAEAIARLNEDKGVVVSCCVDKHGKLIKKSIVLPSRPTMTERETKGGKRGKSVAAPAAKKKAQRSAASRPKSARGRTSKR